MKGKSSQRRGLRDLRQHVRILFCMLILGVAAFLPVTLQLYSLMILQYDHYASLALRNQSRTTMVTADRGNIYDCNMNLLAGSVSAPNLYLAPRELQQAQVDVDAMASQLGEILGADPQWIRQKALDRSLRYQQIGKRLPEETAAQVRACLQKDNFKGVHLEPGTRRIYPFGSLAAQVLGFTDASNQGVEGIELAYDSFLKGTPGSVITTRGNNEMDMPFSVERYAGARQGCSLILTLDSAVQQCLERQLQNAMDRYQVKNGAFGLVMNCKTGEILAMATLGSFDPNDYQQIRDPKTLQMLENMEKEWKAQPENSQAFRNQKEAYQKALSEARLRQWRNRVISDGYEPGSTFKVLTMAAALDCGAIDLNTDFYCRGAEQIPGRSQLLHCWRHQGHGPEKTAQALQNSCNIAFAHIALKLGGEKFYEYVQRFGILEKTGIDLRGESRGVFFDRALITDTDKWGTASLTSGSFGQTFKLTPIQLVRGIASVVNGGRLMEPYLVSEVLDPEGKTVFKQEPAMIRRTISQETSETMRKLIRSVVTDGTARNAAVAGYCVGGKTGTSEKIDVFDEKGQRVQDKIVSFVGVAPMDDPQYIVLAALDTPSRSCGTYLSGGAMAAPTVGAILRELLPYLGVHREPEAVKSVAVPELQGLDRREAEKKLKELGLSMTAKGEQDAVTAQIPESGQTLMEGGQVLVYFGEEPEKKTLVLPDFRKLNRQQAGDLAAGLGLSLISAGNPELLPQIIVTGQDPAPGTEVKVGSSLTLEFTDTTVRD